MNKYYLECLLIKLVVIKYHGKQIRFTPQISEKKFIKFELVFICRGLCNKYIFVNRKKHLGLVALWEQ